MRPATALPAVDLRTGPDPHARDRWWWLVAGALALVPVLRAAGWVVLPSVFAAFAVASLAATGGRRWGELFAGLGVSWGRLPMGAIVAARIAARDLSARPAAIRGTVFAAVLLAVFVPLLGSADAAFSQLLELLVPSVGKPLGRAIVFVVFLAFGGALLYTAAAPPRPGPWPAKSRLSRLEWAIPLGALVALLGAFVAIQFATLFGGERHVLDTAGLSYAEYARSGFGQLLAVAALTLAVVAAAHRWAHDDGRLLKALLAALCLLTLVVLASSLKRLNLLEDAYGFTRVRFAAHAMVLWLGALFALVLVGRARPRVVVALTAVTVLAFALADPDRRIARWNVDRYERTGKIDKDYLMWLSAYATPELVRFPCMRFRPGPQSLVGWNVARAQARAAVTAPRPASCPERVWFTME